MKPCNGCSEHDSRYRKPCPECQPYAPTQPIMTQPMSAGDYERALEMIEQRSDLSRAQRAAMRDYLERHYLAATDNHGEN